MAKVVFKRIRKVYDKNVVAVADASFEVADKEFVVLVGPSGCGKSTTLRMVAGLEEISDGELYIGDRLVNDVSPKDRDIAMVFQNYALYPHMTVFDNMAFALKIRNIKKSEIKERVLAAAAILNISELLQRKPKALSGGQRQRVAIGRAIVREPQVFLMDEPLSNLDAKLRNQMRAEIIKLHKSIDTTFIYVTHDQTEAMTLGDRIVIMKDGFIQQIGTPHEVFDHPANLFVAGFVGTPQMNFFAAKLVNNKGRYAVLIDKLKNATGEVTIDLTDKMNAILLKKRIVAQEITLGIRPEHLSLAQPEEKDALSAKVEISEMMGSEVHLHLAVHKQDVVMKVSTVDLEKYYQKTGDKTKIAFRFPAALIHLFSAANERNLTSIEKYDIAFVGHMCYDEVLPFGGEPIVAPGSAVLCGAMVTSRIGVKTAAFVKMSLAEEEITQEMKERGVDVHIIPADCTTYSRVVHESADVDERKITLVRSAGLIKISDLPDFEARWVHLGGISDSEFDMALIDGLKKRGYRLSVDMQSFVRQIDPLTREINFADVADKKAIIAKMDKVKLDVVEAKVLTGCDDLEEAATIVESWGCPEIMITHSQGVLVRADQQYYYEKFSNKSVIGRTGRGDTVFAAYLAQRLEYGVAESLKFAAALVSLKMENYGPFKGTVQDVKKRIKEKHSD